MLFNDRTNIRPRDLRETVTLFQRDNGMDEYGVQAFADPQPICEVFASVDEMSGYSKMQFYQSVEVEAYDVRMRYVPCAFNEIKWNGKQLVVDNIEDEGMRGRWLRVRCSRRGNR